MPKVLPLDPPLVVERVCCVGSLGDDVAGVAAAMRCRMARPSELPGHDVETPDGDVEPVRGHAAPGLAPDLAGNARLARLLEALFVHVARRLDGGASRPYLIVAVPEADRFRHGIDFRTGEPLAGRDPDRIDRTVDGESLVATSLDAAGLTDRFARVKVVETGTVRWARLLSLAHGTLKREPGATVVLASVDSLCGPDGLDWLERTGRLRTAIHPVGDAPGEGANALFLSLASSRTASPAHVRMESIVVERDPAGPFDGAPITGKALGSVLAAHRADGPGDWWLANLTGEEPFAYEWAMGGMEARAEHGVGIDAPPWLAAPSVGDVGIAWPGLALGWAGQAAARGYAPDGRCGVVALDASRERALLSVSVG